MQSLVGEYAISRNHKPVILVTDGEDTAKICMQSKVMFTNHFVIKY